MDRLAAFIQGLEPTQRAAFTALENPPAIQAFLDAIPYSCEPVYRSPRQVLTDRLAHCFDGALLAAAALWRLGHPPLIVDMVAERDDDHILAVFKQNGCWGAVAKSNFSGLRYREPVYRSLRELVMSYFELYYNTAREKTLRGYTGPLNLRTFDRCDWLGSDAGLERIAERLDAIRLKPLLSPQQLAGLELVDERSFAAGLAGADPAGLYQPGGDTI